MNSLLFVLKRGFSNKLKRAAKKPKTYIFGTFIILYFIFIGATLISLVSSIKGDKIPIYVAGYSALMIFTLVTNVLTYAKKKGLIFTKADINFCCSSPVNPKLVLIYAGYRNFMGNIFLSILAVILGVFACATPVLSTILLSLMICVLETVLEMSLIIILYGSEKVTKKMSYVIRGILYACTAAMAVLLIVLSVKEGSFGKGFNIAFNGDYIMAIPIFGWNVALIRLVMLGPSAWNIVNSIIYLLAVIIIAVIAKCISCNGDYYEHAMTFADDYEVALKKSKDGQIAVVGKKTKFKKANVNYKGQYSKAIYYKQMLEGKKQRFGRFGISVYIFLLIGCVVAFMCVVEGAEDKYVPYIIIGISLYINLLLSALKSKLELELKNPYTYLIPDTNFKKLFYSTKNDIERSFLEGAFMVLPVAVVTGLNPIKSILLITLHAASRCLRFYICVCVDLLMGELMVPFAKNFIDIMVFFTAVLIGAGITFALSLTGIIELALLGALVYAVGLIVGTMFIASFNFARMEKEI